MKESQRCPKCRHRTLIVVDEVRQPASGPSIRPLYPAAAVTDPSSFGPGVAAGGRFETWICQTCGSTEWYTTGLDDLVALSKVPGSGVRLVVAEVDGGSGPYR